MVFEASRRSVFFFVLLFILILIAYGFNEHKYVDLREEWKSPYSKLVQLDTLFKVLTLMNYKYDPHISMPTIKVADNVSEKEYDKAIGLPTGNKRTNLYDPITNTIYILKDMQVHNLAHEFAHYVQIKYKRLSPKDIKDIIDLADLNEMEAVHIQNYFR